MARCHSSFKFLGLLLTLLLAITTHGTSPAIAQFNASMFNISLQSMRKQTVGDDVFIIHQGRRYRFFDASQTEVTIGNIARSLGQIFETRDPNIALECILGPELTALSQISGMPRNQRSFICVDPDDVIGNQITLSIDDLNWLSFSQRPEIYATGGNQQRHSILVLGRYQNYCVLVFCTETVRVDGWAYVGRTLSIGEAATRFSGKLARSVDAVSALQEFAPNGQQR